MTGDDNRNVWKMFGIERVGMVANVNEFDAAKFSQSPWKNNEFVDVARPFSEELKLRRDKTCEMGFGTRQFGRNSQLAQFAQGLIRLQKKIEGEQAFLNQKPKLAREFIPEIEKRTRPGPSPRGGVTGTAVILPGRVEARQRPLRTAAKPRLVG